MSRKTLRYAAFLAVAIAIPAFGAIRHGSLDVRRYNGISFDWYEQTDGATDFSGIGGIGGIGVGPARRAFAPGRIPGVSSRTFGIDGRMSRAPSRGVIIARGACGARFSDIPAEISEP